MKSKRQKKLMTLATVLILLLFIVATALLILITTKQPALKNSFSARSIHDASYDCEDKILKRYFDNLIHQQFDNLSSHYDAENGRYAIFYRISVEEDIPGQPYSEVNEYMVKCLVWEKMGYVSEFTVIDF